MRHVSPFFLEGDRLLPHLSLVAAERLLGAGPDDVKVEPGERILLRPGASLRASAGGLRCRIDAHGRLLVNWPIRGGADWRDVFTHIPYGSFLDLASCAEDIAGNARDVAPV